jgi:hypothetical protein
MNGLTRFLIRLLGLALVLVILWVTITPCLAGMIWGG